MPILTKKIKLLNYFPIPVAAFFLCVQLLLVHSVDAIAVQSDKAEATSTPATGQIVRILDPNELFRRLREAISFDIGRFAKIDLKTSPSDFSAKIFSTSTPHGIKSFNEKIKETAGIDLIKLTAFIGFLAKTLIQWIINIIILVLQ